MNRTAEILTPTPLQDLEKGAHSLQPFPLHVALAPVLKTKPSELGFGTVFTDHMLVADYEPSGGWTARIEPYGPLALDPATAALHYGQSVFDGMKAFRGDDGVVRVFRPERHLQRLAQSASRLCMQAPEPDLALAWLLQLLRLERDWVPSHP